ncbi:uncharacterized protein LOC131878905 isoform X1 [Tigriopus californicus]|uniref:uncharacterized protein LOC131878905 isoform X1 n=1 Tax=Tigriopus californicus TaxID=6832 RepID=UPI0027DA3AC4|nr:uncharacterized protein LOC131878905 isoform X1 [Tigriopus californicus]
MDVSTDHHEVDDEDMDELDEDEEDEHVETCRICGQHGPGHAHILGETGQRRQLAEKIRFCFSTQVRNGKVLNVHAHDGLSKWLCQECQQSLNNSFANAKKIQEFQFTLKRREEARKLKNKSAFQLSHFVHGDTNYANRSPNASDEKKSNSKVAVQQVNDTGLYKVSINGSVKRPQSLDLSLEDLLGEGVNDQDGRDGSKVSKTEFITTPDMPIGNPEMSFSIPDSLMFPHYQGEPQRTCQAERPKQVEAGYNSVKLQQDLLAKTPPVSSHSVSPAELSAITLPANSLSHHPIPSATLSQSIVSPLPHSPSLSMNLKAVSQSMFQHLTPQQHLIHSQLSHLAQSTRTITATSRSPSGLTPIPISELSKEGIFTSSNGMLKVISLSSSPPQLPMNALNTVSGSSNLAANVTLPDGSRIHVPIVNGTKLPDIQMLQNQLKNNDLLSQIRVPSMTTSLPMTPMRESDDMVQSTISLLSLGSGSFKCTQCSISFKNADVKTMVKHCLTAHGTANTLFGCPMCHEKNDNPTKILEHMKMYHDDGICGNDLSADHLFNNMNKTNINNNIIHPAVEAPTPPSQPIRQECSVCHESYTTKAAMKIHMQNAHFATGLHECPTCQRMFSSRATLKRHQLTHAGSRSFTCKVCAANFGQKSALTTHSKTHDASSTVTNLFCSCCEKQFDNRQTFNSHLTECRGRARKNNAPALQLPSDILAHAKDEPKHESSPIVP